jgi:outer membrane protein
MHVEEQKRREVVRQTREAFNSVISGISRVKALKQAVASNEKALESTQAGYDVGTRTTVDVLNARRELFSAKRDYARARYNYILSTLRLKQAAGIISVDDLEKINQWIAS